MINKEARDAAWNIGQYVLDSAMREKALENEDLNSIIKKAFSYLDQYTEKDRLSAYHSLRIVCQTDRRNRLSRLFFSFIYRRNKKSFVPRWIKKSSGYGRQKEIEKAKKLMEALEEKERSKTLKEIPKTLNDQNFLFVACVVPLCKELGVPPLESKDYILLKLIFSSFFKAAIDKETKAVDKEKLNDWMREVLKGAHVRLFDEGAFYRTVSEMDEAVKRNSSHYNKKASAESFSQYGYSTPAFPELLVGKEKEKGQYFSWFQMERHARRENARWGKERILHDIDWIQYKVFHKNVGPYGLSRYREKAPLRIR